MKIRKRINKNFDHDEDGVQVAGGVNAVVSVNVDESGSSHVASSHQRQRIVQREGRTVAESESEGREPTDTTAHEETSEG
jgi:hypothetical protein